jgi:hypothetical protein
VENDGGDVFEADLSAGVLRWWRNGDLLNECSVPEQMKDKTTFLYISLFLVY